MVFLKKWAEGSEQIRTWLAVSLVLVVVLFPWTSPAVERGIMEYSNGAQNFYSGVLPPPPPGFYAMYNFVYYQANKFAGVSVPDHFEAVGNAFNFTYVSPLNFFGANVAASASVPLTHFSNSLSPDLHMNDNQIRGMLRLVKDKTWTVARVKAIVGDVIKVRDLAREASVRNGRQKYAGRRAGLVQCAIRFLAANKSSGFPITAP